MNKYYKTLELDKILEMLANEASNEKTKQMALEIEPSFDIFEVNNEIKKTSQAFELSVKFGTPPFTDFKDVSNSLMRAKSGARLSLKELIEIGRILSQIKILSDWYKHCTNIETELSYLFTRLMPNEYLQSRIETSIVSEDEIADSASSELASIRRKKYQAGMRVREILDKMTRSTTIQKYLQEAIVTIRDGRYVLPVKAEHRGDIQGLIHGTSSSGQTYFIEPISIVEANNDIRLLESKEQEEIDRIITELCAECGKSADTIIDNYNICVELNLYFAKSNLAAKMKATTPIISDDGVISLKKARHPLIDKERVVPIDISLGEDYQVLIITGPNTGGKTVALKTAGLLTLMTMCGLLIPVSDGSKVSIFNNILADIGDNQSIEHNLSTFSSHTNKVIEIIDLADENSLILLDELGSGTDPVEGAALAIAIIEKLKSKNAKLMVTTHYQELKMYAVESQDVENASFEFNIETLQPTYRLIIGSPGKSNAFAISSSLGMPKDVIEYAQSIVSVENKRFENVIEQLENSRIELEKQNEEISKLKVEHIQKVEELRKELDDLKYKKEKELERARITAMSIIEDTKAKSNEIIDELDKLRKEKDKDNFSQMVSGAKSRSKNVFNKMYDIANPVEEKININYKLPRPLKKGDSVLITDIDKKGVVTSISDGDTVLVQVGVIRTKVDINKLRLLENEKVTFKNKPISPTMNVKSKVDRSAMLELDIRGCSSDEGIHQLESFIDNAVMSNIGTVTIIHGKGTGVLRSAIQKRLKEMPSVKSFRYGVYGEGEDGVTIVELK
jgi:DNA mismatch repair protein MutS2